MVSKFLESVIGSCTLLKQNTLNQLLQNMVLVRDGYQVSIANHANPFHILATKIGAIVGGQVRKIETSNTCKKETNHDH